MKKVYLNTLTPEEIIKRLKNGEVVRLKDSEVFYKMIDGIIVKFKDTIKTFGYLYVDEYRDYYFEEQEEFKVEKTGRYKTRDGEIAFVHYIRDENIYGVIVGYKNNTYWYKDGTHLTSSLDLVEYVGD